MHRFVGYLGRAWLACLACAAIFGSFFGALSAHSAATLEQQVRQIGPEDRLADDISALRSNPHAAAKLLVGELHAIPRKTYFEKMKTKDVLHVLGCLRALHYLTGLTFTASTKAHLTDDERQFLDFHKQMHDANPGHQLHFFGVWMSRNADIVAPMDVQHKIIERWHNWAKEHADSFEYAPPADPKASIETWFWFG